MKVTNKEKWLLAEDCDAGKCYKCDNCDGGLWLRTKCGGMTRLNNGGHMDKYQLEASSRIKFKLVEAEVVTL